MYITLCFGFVEIGIVQPKMKILHAPSSYSTPIIFCDMVTLILQKLILLKYSFLWHFHPFEIKKHISFDKHELIHGLSTTSLCIFLLCTGLFLPILQQLHLIMFNYCAEDFQFGVWDYVRRVNFEIVILCVFKVWYFFVFCG